MYIKTKINEALRRESLELRPSSLKHWWKVPSGETGTTMADVIGGADYTHATGSHPSDGQFTPATSAQTGLALGAAVEDPGTKNILFLFNGDVNAFALLGLGSATGNTVSFGDGIITQTKITGASGTVQALDSLADTSGVNKTHILWYDGTDAHSKIDAAAINDTTGDPGAITLPDTINVGSVVTITGIALFVFDGAIPADLVRAALFMGEQWESLNKVLYPSDLAEWGTWS